MKPFKVAVGLCLVALSYVATASPREAIEALDRAEKVKDIVVLFPQEGFNSDFSAEGQAKAALASPELTIQTSRVQTISDTLYAVASSARVECMKSDSQVLGLVRIEFNDKHIDDYYLTSSQLVDRKSGQCFPLSAWVSNVLSLWDSPASP